MRIVNLILLLFCGLFTPALCGESFSLPSIKIVYPKAGNTIEASSTFLVGQVSPGSTLTCDGAAVKVNQPGFFAHVVPLQYGSNHFVLTSSNDQGTKSILDWTVFRKPPIKPINFDELKIDDLKPSVDMGVTAGDVINFSVRATPHSLVTVQLGTHQISLSSGQKPSLASDVAYGKVNEHGNSPGADLYRASYHVAAGDHFLAMHPRFRLVSSKGDILVTSKATITTVEHLQIARTVKAPTVVRLGPGLARTTPLVEGVKLVIDGWLADNMRCSYSPNCHVWVKRQDLIFEPAITQDARLFKANNGMVPQAVARTINIVPDNYGDNICLPLTERLPYQIEQKLNPNCLILRVYGVQSDTDWITSEPKDNADDRSILDHVSWRQAEDNVYEITVHLSGNRQWGYQVGYNDTTLALNVKHSPLLSSDATLRGVKICLDPGHGGSETGSVGCSGVPESQVNFEIATKVKSYLEELGATVILTRTAQNQYVSLEDRVKIATENQADFLLSIHNNALPDGRDPWKEHGTSSYWYYPQSLELAKSLKTSVKQTSGFLDLGARYQNLALARANGMPSVLLEIGFMINPDEFTNLIDPQFQSRIAESIANGIKQYLYPKQ